MGRKESSVSFQHDYERLRAAYDNLQRELSESRARVEWLARERERFRQTLMQIASIHTGYFSCCDCGKVAEAVLDDRNESKA
jgi:predicted RNase H-like nuclease (RuvC/YqgF family)